MKDELARLPGVAEARIIAAGETELRVWIDAEKLAARSLAAADVLDVLQAQNLQAAASRIGTPPKDRPFGITVKSLGRLASAEELGAVILKTTEAGQVVRLSDVARIELTAGPGQFSEMDGKPAALVAVTATRGKLTAADIRKAIGGNAALPPGVRVVPARRPVRGFGRGDRSASARWRLGSGRPRSPAAAALIRKLPGSPVYAIWC